MAKSQQIKVGDVCKYLVVNLLTQYSLTDLNFHILSAQRFKITKIEEVGFSCHWWFQLVDKHTEDPMEIGWNSYFITNGTKNFSPPMLEIVQSEKQNRGHNHPLTKVFV